MDSSRLNLETAADAGLCVRQIPTKLHLAPAATGARLSATRLRHCVHCNRRQVTEHAQEDLLAVQEAAGEAPAGRPEVRGRAPPAAL